MIIYQIWHKIYNGLAPQSGMDETLI